MVTNHFLMELIKVNLDNFLATKKNQYQFVSSEINYILCIYNLDPILMFKIKFPYLTDVTQSDKMRNLVSEMIVAIENERTERLSEYSTIQLLVDILYFPELKEQHIMSDGWPDVLYLVPNFQKWHVSKNSFALFGKYDMELCLQVFVYGNLSETPTYNKMVTVSVHSENTVEDARDQIRYQVVNKYTEYDSYAFGTFLIRNRLTNAEKDFEDSSFISDHFFEDNDIFCCRVVFDGTMLM